MEEIALTLLFAGLGGLSGFLLDVYNLPQLPRDQRPVLTSPAYLTSRLAAVALALILAAAYHYSETKLSPIMALHVGISAPLAFAALAKTSFKPVEEVDETS